MNFIDWIYQFVELTFSFLLLFFISAVKCMVQHEEGDTLGRITLPIQEAFLYDTLALSKIDMDTATVQLSVCGRNRRTAQAIPIATLSLPLAAGIKVTLAQYFPLEYKICLPTPPIMQENATMVSNMSENGKLLVVQ